MENEVEENQTIWQVADTNVFTDMIKNFEENLSALKLSPIKVYFDIPEEVKL